MYLQDILPRMSKLYLGRTVDSFLKDVHMEAEDDMREVILKNIDEFQNRERVKRHLDFSEESRHTNQEISRSLINLQTRGLILRFREDTSYYIIPEDIARILRYEMGENYEMKYIERYSAI